MTSAEIKKNLPEIGKFYELHKGFVPCRQKIGVSTCRYCSADNESLQLNKYQINSGNYGDSKLTCGSHFTGLCPFTIDKKQKCLKTAEEFNKIYLEYDDFCADKTNSLYALFMYSNE